MMVIIGGGGLARELAREVCRRGERPLCLVPDSASARAMRGTGARVVRTPEERMARRVPAGADAAFVVTGRGELNASISRELRRLRPDILILAEASGRGAAGGLRLAGADLAVEPARLAASGMLERMGSLEGQRAARRLVSVIDGCGGRGLAVFLHDDPDPDTIASGLALKRICAARGVRCGIYHGGSVSGESSKLLVSMLGARLRRVESPEEAARIAGRYGAVALVESSVPGRNNILPPGARVDIVIDHHPLSPSLWPEGGLVDIRPELGAASTMLTGYLRRLWIRPDPALASALIFGIKVDTADLTRSVHPEDLEALGFLAEQADLRLVRRLEAPPLSASAAAALARAIMDRELISGHLLAFAGRVRDRETLARAADFLLRLDGVCASLVWGIIGGMVHISARTDQHSLDVGGVLQRAFGRLGSAGGHANSAGASVPLPSLAPGVNGDRALALARQRIRERYLRAAGLSGGSA